MSPIFGDRFFGVGVSLLEPKAEDEKCWRNAAAADANDSTCKKIFIIITLKKIILQQQNFVMKNHYHSYHE